MPRSINSFGVLLLIVPPLALAGEAYPTPIVAKSPDGTLQVDFRLGPKSNLEFAVTHRGVELARGNLGLAFAELGAVAEDLEVLKVQRASRDETYAIPVGKASSARDQHEEIVVSVRQSSGRRLEIDIAFRVFNDGIAFRYVLPKQEALSDFTIVDELTELAFTGDPAATALPLASYTTSYEAYYDATPLSKLKAGQLYGMPMLLKTGNGAWVAVTEADLTDYAGMYLVREKEKLNVLRARLSPLTQSAAPKGLGPNVAKVVGRTPFASPWRVLMMAADPGGLIESNLIFHLNPPSKISDASWIKPGKTTFPWWNHYVLEGVDFKPGVNTATMKHYIDFCAEEGIPYHSLDGLDIAWYGGPIAPSGPTDVTKAAPSINMPELLRYAEEKGVRLRLWMHWKALQPQLDEAFATYERWGIEGVMIDFMDRDDQEMVRWYHEVAQKAAKHRLTVTWHGAYKPTGMERTWPNVLSYEGVLNQEYNKWSEGTPPKHNLDVAFVRMLAGPLDYHQGGMRNVLPENYRPRDVAPPVQGTRGHQLAMYVVYQNHLPMLADYPSAYRGQPGFKLLVDVPTNWDETRVLHADIGKCIVLARRCGKDWYLGGMTAAAPQKLNLDLKFVGAGKFDAELYFDDESKGPTALTIQKRPLTASDTLEVVIPASGGFAARLVEAKE